MTDYTPTTDEVRDAFIDFRVDCSNSPLTIDEAEVQFNSWLAEHDALILAAGQEKAWAEGHATWWNRGPDDCDCDVNSWLDCGCGLYMTGDLLSLEKNPYRAAKIEDSSA